MFLSSRVTLALSGAACLLATPTSGFSSLGSVRSSTFGLCSFTTQSVLAVSPTAEDNDVDLKADEIDEVPVSVPVEAEEDSKVYIGNLSFDQSKDSIKTVFEAFGTVSDVYLPTDRDTGKGRGFGFVSMPDEAAANKAIEDLDNSVVGGRTVYVNVAGGEPRKKKKPQEDLTKSKLYVGNISFETSVEELEVHFSQFGEIHDCYIPRFPEGNSRGFAFVTLDSEVAETAIESSNGIDLNGRSIAVSKSLSPNEKKQQRPSNKRASYAKSTKIYVGNLSYETDEDTLRPIFEELGTVHDFYMPMDQDYEGQNRGFAFATMPEEEASRAIEELNDVEVDGRMIRVNEAQQRA